MFFISLITVVSRAQHVIIKDINVGSDIGQVGGLLRVFQDHQGFVWMGTAYGLLRYDGYEFVKYMEFPNSIPRIDEDRNGLLWLHTAGLYVMDPESKNSTYYNPPHTTQVNIPSIKVIEDKNGFIWCSMTNGLYKMEPKIRDDEQLKNTIFKYGIDSAFNISLYRFTGNDTSKGIWANSLFDIYEDSRGMIWVGGFPGLFVYNAESDEFIRMDDDSNDNSRLASLKITDIVEENPDIMWLCIHGGTVRISNVANAVSGPVIDKTRLDFRSYAPDFRIDEELIIRRFLMDDQKYFWLGGDINGLIKMSIDQNGDAIFERIYPEIDEPIGGLFNTVTSIIKDHKYRI